MAVFGFAAGSGYGNAYIDSLIWGGVDNNSGKWTGGPITYYFGSGPYPDDPDDDFDPEGLPFARAWLESEKDAFRTALQLYANVANLQFQEVGNLGLQSQLVASRRQSGPVLRPSPGAERAVRPRPGWHFQLSAS